MKTTGFKIAASATILSMVLVSTAAQSGEMRRADRQAAPANRDAAQLHADALRAVQEGRLPAAQDAMEQAVAIAPRDAGYRLLLADIYMRSGRFQSARATYADVIEIDPSNSRAGLGIALMEIALGRTGAAISRLYDLEGRAPGADVGLGLALAGRTERAIEILEPLARGYSSTPRIRQNLALAYALAGDWRRARAVAAQDISPALLQARLEQWAAIARPDAVQLRVAGLLGVNPVADPGQPTRLALTAPVETQVALAEAAPVDVQLPAAPSRPVELAAIAAPVIPAPAVPAAPAPAAQVSDWGLPVQPEAAPVQVVQASAPAPAVVAEAPTYYTPAPAAPEQAPTPAEVDYAFAARSLSQPAPTVIRAAAVSLPAPPAFRRAAPRQPVRAGNSRFVVQLGAFSNEANAERAWVNAQNRFGLRAHAPLTATVNLNGRTLHRVAVAGFAGQADARQLCNTIRAQGGTCFVRLNAGDASIRWAARYANPRSRNV